MRCIADIHYEVIRHKGNWGEVMGLACKFCVFYISKHRIPQPRTSKSGLGRYNRMRGKMVKHLHEKHREELKAS